jgi:vancomycin resistance protein YoaR
MATPVRQDLYSSDTLSLRGFERRSPPRKTGSAWWLVPTLLIIAALATILGGLTYLDQRYAGKIYPNVSIQGVDLTEMTAAQAAAALHQRFDTFLRAPVRFQYAGRSWEPAAEEIGLKVNFEAQVAEALRAGRGNGLVDDLSEAVTIWRQGLDLPLHMTVDGRKLQQYLVQAAGEVEQPARQATLIVDTTKGAAQVTESAEGRMLLLDETVAEAIEGLHTLEQQKVVVRTRTLDPGLATKDVAEAKRTVDAMLQAPMELQFTQEKLTFPLSQTDIADMIAIRRTVDGQRTVLNAQLDQDKLRKWATKLADKVGRESVEPRVAWNGGNLQIIHEGRTAYRLDIERTMEMINGAILGAKRSVDLPVNEDQPEATAENLANLGIKELIASGKSDFTGSAAYRITNIKAGVNLINGILVPPDEEFSFNENVGAIDAEHGFAEGYSIIGNRTQKDPGGGICQVSTTLFRAAFYSGLPFTDWTPHRFRISWYEKYDSIGMDSTIYTGGGPDLRFKNDTDHWILIEGIVDEGQKMVTFNIYGTQVPGRTVEKIGPEISKETPAPKEPVYIDDPDQPVGATKQTDTARGGLEVEIWRVIKQDGVEVRRARFLTQFQPWPNIFLKNPKTPLPPGAKLGTG